MRLSAILADAGSLLVLYMLVRPDRHPQWRLLVALFAFLPVFFFWLGSWRARAAYTAAAVATWRPSRSCAGHGGGARGQILASGEISARAGSLARKLIAGSTGA